MNEIDEQHLRRAIELAVAARAAGQRPYGALIVGRAGVVLAEDHNTVLADRDITAHPELKLARWAAAHLDRPAVRDTVMYSILAAEWPDIERHLRLKLARDG